MLRVVCPSMSNGRNEKWKRTNWWKYSEESSCSCVHVCYTIALIPTEMLYFICISIKQSTLWSHNHTPSKVTAAICVFFWFYSYTIYLSIDGFSNRFCMYRWGLQFINYHAFPYKYSTYWVAFCIVHIYVGHIWFWAFALCYRNVSVLNSQWWLKTNWISFFNFYSF